MKKKQWFLTGLSFSFAGIILAISICFDPSHLEKFEDARHLFYTSVENAMHTLGRYKHYI